MSDLLSTDTRTTTRILQQFQDTVSAYRDDVTNLSIRQEKTEGDLKAIKANNNKAQKDLTATVNGQISQLRSTQSEVSAIQERLKQAQGKFEGFDEKITEITNSSSDIQSLSDLIDSVNVTISGLQTTVSSHKKTIGELLAMEAEVSERLKDMQGTPQSEPLDAVLSPRVLSNDVIGKTLGGMTQDSHTARMRDSDARSRRNQSAQTASPDRMPGQFVDDSLYVVSTQVSLIDAERIWLRSQYLRSLASLQLARMVDYSRGLHLKYASKFSDIADTLRTQKTALEEFQFWPDVQLMSHLLSYGLLFAVMYMIWSVVYASSTTTEGGLRKQTLREGMYYVHWGSTNVWNYILALFGFEDYVHVVDESYY